MIPDIAFFDLIISITQFLSDLPESYKQDRVETGEQLDHEVIQCIFFFFFFFFFFLAICFKDTIHHVLIEYSLIIKDFSDMTGFLDNSFYSYTPQRLFKYDFISD